MTGRLSDVYVGVLVGGEQEDLEAKQLHEAVNISAVMTRDGTDQAALFWRVSKGNLLWQVVGFFIAYNACVRFDFDVGSLPTMHLTTPPRNGYLRIWYVQEHLPSAHNTDAKAWHPPNTFHWTLEGVWKSQWLQ